jgi:hypothetical protein
MKAWRADPLVWGHGPRIFEVFLEPTCPFSVKAFGKFDDLLDQAGEDRITVKLHLQSQPWHMYSGVIVRCILAASTLEGGKTAAKSVMAAVAAHREEFEFDRHCRGPNLDATPNDIIRRIERYSGVKLAEAFAIPDLDREVERHCRYARQNGIHVSPTFMVDRAGPARHEQWRPSRRLGGAPIGSLTLRLVQEAGPARPRPVAGGKPVYWWPRRMHGGVRANDSLLEGGGFELSVPRFE